MARADQKTAGAKARTNPGKAPQADRAYHHGALKEALLHSAEDILKEQGIAGLSIRETARRAGVSHAAPKNHFGDIKGLLSELAGVGFRRLAALMAEAIVGAKDANATMDAIGRSYVAFALGSPGLFHLMYRSEALDFSRPALSEAIASVADTLKAAVISRNANRKAGKSTPLETVASMATSWCLVHGFATLLIDHRLDPMLAHVPGEDKAQILLDAVLASIKVRQG